MAAAAAAALAAAVVARAKIGVVAGSVALDELDGGGEREGGVHVNVRHSDEQAGGAAQLHALQRERQRPARQRKVGPANGIACGKRRCVARAEETDEHVWAAERRREEEADCGDGAVCAEVESKEGPAARHRVGREGLPGGQRHGRGVHHARREGEARRGVAREDGRVVPSVAAAPWVCGVDGERIGSVGRPPPGAVLAHGSAEGGRRIHRRLTVRDAIRPVQVRQRRRQRRAVARDAQVGVSGQSRQRHLEGS
mmetsp:Transcript_5706/g.18142  ORF Transcript_5706/g.18142 Transcript_5706/m.18142 type:complete len:254 (-) Transcript_5706:4852-5613(-)|eukprot:scaffold5375_cov110-Isochrysis_galbana.AAC.12